MNKYLSNYFLQLKKKFSNPELELRILINKSSLRKKEIILSNFKIEDINLLKFDYFFNRRIKGEPISKIFNSKSFWKYDFFVTEDVLDPRPETELIIENILQSYPKKNDKLKILDICTGSGCLAISLAKEFLKADIVATDISKKAINIAKINAKKLKCENIEFIVCDILDKLDKYDIVISNPPYISELDYQKISKEIKIYEPKIALMASNQGYEFYYKISKILPQIITKKSKSYIEIGSSQANKAIDIFSSNGINCLKVVKDIQNLDRVLILNKS